MGSTLGRDSCRLSVDVVKFRGHANVRATHRTTFEITRDSELTPRGDCIIGVEADKALADLSQELRETIMSEGALVLVLVVDELGRHDVILGSGNPRLKLSDDRRMIVRRSSFVDSSTLLVKATKSAADLDRGLVNDLKSGASAKAYIVGIPLDCIASRLACLPPSRESAVFKC